MAVAIVGCVGLALCIAAVVLRPMDAQRRRLRPLANVGRLTELPEFVRAIRLRRLSTLVVVTLLGIALAGAVIAGARPTGLPEVTSESASVQPEDIMLCIGGPTSDPAAAAALRYFAERMPLFGTQRIGLTTPSRRLVPLTRDYQYVAGEFARLAKPDGTGEVVSPLSYVDYAGGVEDLLALCLTGFPNFDRESPQRRSLIYVGPDTLRPPDEPRPALFTTARVEEMATTAGVQVNVVSSPEANALVSLARDTGGLSFVADPDVATQLTAIRDNPPSPTATDIGRTTAEPTETPGIPLLLALLSALALAAFPVVMHR